MQLNWIIITGAYILLNLTFVAIKNLTTNYAQHNTPLPDNSRPSVQFITDYTHADGTRRKRVTTIQRQ